MSKKSRNSNITAGGYKNTQKNITPPTMTTQFFALLGLGILSSGLLTITAKNPVIAVIFLISTFVLSAGLLILLGINFIGLSYIVIYVGAIAVLFLFVIMMIHIRLSEISESGADFTQHLPLAVAILFLFLFIFLNLIALNLISNGETVTAEIGTTFSWWYNSMGNSFNLVREFLTNMGNPEASLVNNTQMEGIGSAMYTELAILLVILSSILLVAMFAIIVITYFD
jgi:NADH-ubiquinone oxidoreductase chain 6